MFCTVFIFSKIQEELKMKKVIAIVLAVMMLCAVTVSYTHLTLPTIA